MPSPNPGPDPSPSPNPSRAPTPTPSRDPGPGDLLRDEVKKGSEAGRRIAEMIKEGKIVPTQVRTLLRSLDAPNATLTPNPEPRTPNPYLFKEADAPNRDPGPDPGPDPDH